MKSLQGLPERIKLGLASYAMQVRNRQGNQLSLADQGAAVAQAEGRAEPYSADTLHAWITGREYPPFAAICAIGALYLSPSLPNRELHVGGLLYGSDAVTYSVTEDDYYRYLGLTMIADEPKPLIGFRA